MSNSNTEDDTRLLPITLLYTSEFKRSLRRLTKKYRRIRTDLQPIFDRLLAHETPGDRIPGTDAVV